MSIDYVPDTIKDEWFKILKNESFFFLIKKNHGVFSLHLNLSKKLCESEIIPIANFIFTQNDHYSVEKIQISVRPNPYLDEYLKLFFEQVTKVQNNYSSTKNMFESFSFLEQDFPEMYCLYPEEKIANIPVIYDTIIRQSFCINEKINLSKYFFLTEL